MPQAVIGCDLSRAVIDICELPSGRIGQIANTPDAIAASDRGVEKEASDALAAFRRAATLSPDLISADARLLVKTAEQMMTDAFGGGPIAAAHRGPIGPVTLADIPLLEVAK